MSKNVLLIGGQPDSAFVTAVRKAALPLGKLDLVAPSALEHVNREDYDLILVDAAETTEVAELIASIHRRIPGIPIVVLTNSPTWELAREAFLAGATDYLTRSLDVNTLRAAFSEVLGKQM